MKKKILVIVLLAIISLSIYGQTWSSVGTGINNVALAMAVYNAELYVGGQFTTAGSFPANYIARWTITTGVQESLPRNTISVFPNPSNRKFIFEVTGNREQMTSLEIYNVLGEKIHSNTINRTYLKNNFFSIVIYLLFHFSLFFSILSYRGSRSIDKMLIFEMTSNITMTVDLSSQPKNIYILKINDGKKIYTEKIIIQ